MTTDDLNAPLGQQTEERRQLPPGSSRRRSPACSACSCWHFSRWALIADDPLGGEPMRRRGIARPAPTSAKTLATGPPGRTCRRPDPSRRDGRHGVARHADRHHHRRIERQAAGSRRSRLRRSEAQRRAVDTKLLEISRHGPIPKIATDGARPPDAYARKPGRGRQSRRTAHRARHRRARRRRARRHRRRCRKCRAR